jgi:hypothetical protein
MGRDLKRGECGVHVRTNLECAVWLWGWRDVRCDAHGAVGHYISYLAFGRLCAHTLSRDSYGTTNAPLSAEYCT